MIYFAGHGATLTFADGRAMGYVVPADAPTPTDDQAGFEDVALDMQTIETYAKQIRSKHALFVFDSCFSGSVFYVTRAGVPPVISYKAAKPVRQLITSGSETENVPDVSIFREQFVAALNGEGSDLNGDGFLTGEELGLFLEDKVINYSNDTQHPQYGKIRDPKLDKGDVVFALPKAAPPASTPPDAPDAPQVTFSLDDAAVVPESWRQYAEQMSAAFAQAREYDAQPRHTAAKKAAAWQKFLTTFAADNVYDAQDEEMRQYAAQRIADLRQPTPRPSQEGTTHPTPSQEGNTELPSSEGPGVGSCWENETQGAECREKTTGMEFVFVPGGCFQMGQTDTEKAQLLKEVSEKEYNQWFARELPRHQVCVKGFWMGKYEVTNSQYRRFKADHDSQSYDGKSLNGDDQPVVMVSWNDAQAFTAWLTKQGGGEFRLPTEAEWEYAARGGTETIRYWGDDPKHTQACQYANVHDRTSKQAFSGFTWQEHDCNDGYAVTAPVGQFEPNAFGLYDMLGNVWEWQSDTYHDSYDGAPNDGSIWGSLGDKKANRLLRGGSWLNEPYNVRGANRSGVGPDGQNVNFGFRLVFSRTQ